MTDLSRIFASSPVNKTAARVLGGGIHFVEREINPQHWHMSAPPTVVPKHLFPKGDFEDLTGRQWGRLTVYGYYGKRNKKKRGLWIVRCACGDYEARTAKTIKSPDEHDACLNCKRARLLKIAGSGLKP